MLENGKRDAPVVSYSDMRGLPTCHTKTIVDDQLKPAGQSTSLCLLFQGSKQCVPIGVGLKVERWYTLILEYGLRFFE